MTSEMDRLLMKAAYTSNDELEKIVNGLSSEQKQTLEDKATYLACRLFFLSGYLLRRGAAGCGDSGHEDSMKVGQKKLKKARKVAGYLRP